MTHYEILLAHYIGILIILIISQIILYIWYNHRK